MSKVCKSFLKGEVSLVKNLFILQNVEEVLRRQLNNNPDVREKMDLLFRNIVSLHMLQKDVSLQLAQASLSGITPILAVFSRHADQFRCQHYAYHTHYLKTVKMLGNIKKSMTPLERRLRLQESLPTQRWKIF
jgi:hypothetical protein